MRSCFMAAYDVFERHRFQGWVMQRCGAFSVDRDGADAQSMRAALKVLVDGFRALTIFPVGNVHFRNDRVGEFLEGAEEAWARQSDHGGAGVDQGHAYGGPA
ncbi:MAG: 1-acyl-sn-glycerol-3-phosphate acyltransferase [Verrucomicrobiales bacterium]